MNINIEQIYNELEKFCIKNYKDILDALYLVKSDEVKIIASVASKLTAEYQSVFAFNNVVCPHCGAKMDGKDGE